MFIAQDFVVEEMVHLVPVNCLLQNLAWHRCERNWSEIRNLMSVTFLKKWNYVGFPPVLLYQHISSAGEPKKGTLAFISVQRTLYPVFLVE